MSLKTYDPVSLESAYRPVAVVFEQLTTKLARSRVIDRDFDRLQYLLETLPVAADEFAVMRVRLENVRRYTSVEELGAARWEALLLSRQLQTLGQVKTREPLRRSLRSV